ncbi:hypothetical protein [Salinivibrio sp. KP-1]|uniref:hypothetical protein n=1 Tax=Salinivibrio sp. KP-1 TaxID=1406902 RepID=UPI0006145C41|nr:hypothetical protein [Salinivibrio sp. KP-1]KKA45900.1 hypothetical protein WN56_01915 [Salinivibrio sp. KP-1]
MNRRTKGVLLGVAGVIFWFMPWVYVNMSNFMGGKFLGMEMYQAGHHVGGIAYLLLLSSAAYAYSSSISNRQFSIISSSISSAISILFLLQAGSSVAWGLLCLIVISVISLAMALKMEKATEVSG